MNIKLLSNKELTLLDVQFKQIINLLLAVFLHQYKLFWIDQDLTYSPIILFFSLKGQKASVFYLFLYSKINQLLFSNRAICNILF